MTLPLHSSTWTRDSMKKSWAAAASHTEAAVEQIGPAYRLKAKLLPYQMASVDDGARFIFDLWSRQSGKDFTATGKVVADCLDRPKITWLIAAPSERQSLETLVKAREWTEAFDVSIASEFEEREAGPQSLLRSATIVFFNGSRIIAVPGKPETVRGFSANVLLTEFAFFEKVNETWRALLPSITNPLRGGRKTVRVITTPNGKGDMVHDIWEKYAGRPYDGREHSWSCRKVTIYDAYRLGLQVNIEELREAMNDPDGFAQEFECEFIDSSNCLLPYDLIALAESAEATEFGEGERPAVGRGAITERFLGVDFGRSSDPTVCWALERVGDVLWTREVLLLHQTDTPEQNAILSRRIAGAQRVALDYTGPGIGFGDYAAREFREWDPAAHRFGKIEKFVFTAKSKRLLFPTLRRAFEAPTRLRIPISREIREDLHAMRQVITNGEYNYWAPRTRQGHSDRCTALALAVHAASGPESAPSAFDAPEEHPRYSRVDRKAVSL